MPEAGTTPSPFASPVPTPCLLPNSSLGNSALTSTVIITGSERQSWLILVYRKKKKSSLNISENCIAKWKRGSHYSFKRVSYYSVRILALPPNRSICWVPIHPFPKHLTSNILSKAPGGSLARRARTEYRTLGAQILVFAQAHLVCPAVVPSGYTVIQIQNDLGSGPLTLASPEGGVRPAPAGCECGGAAE